jgi:endonuclease/exonuclease/phosphatase (EEP) superfamily protein YafD
MRPSSIFTWLVASYAAFILLWYLLRLIFFDRFWPLALLNTIAQYLFVPIPLFLIIAIWQQDRRSLLPLMIPVGLFFILFGELFVPTFSRPVEDTQPSLTVMSFNILHSNRAYTDIAEAVQAASPDLVGFQELTKDSKRALADALVTDYPYHTLNALHPDYSVGLLSRFPIESIESFPLPPLNKSLHVVIHVEESRVHVFVVHLSPNQFFDRSIAEFIPLVIERYGRRAAEVTRLQEEIGNLSAPVLLLCDCNMTDTSAAYARLSSLLNDSFRETGWGFGHTFQPPVVSFPIQRIDYIWHSGEFIAVDAFVGQDGKSDHLPVVVKLRLIKKL